MFSKGSSNAGLFVGSWIPDPIRDDEAVPRPNPLTPEILAAFLAAPRGEALFGGGGRFGAGGALFAGEPPVHASEGEVFQVQGSRNFETSKLPSAQSRGARSARGRRHLLRADVVVGDHPSAVDLAEQAGVDPVLRLLAAFKPVAA